MPYNQGIVTLPVRCKFKIDSIKQTISQKAKWVEGPNSQTVKGHYEYTPAVMYSIEASPVYTNGDPNNENSKFWEASPTGSFVLGTVNAEAVKELKLGQEYFIDLTPA